MDADAREIIQRLLSMHVDAVGLLASQLEQHGKSLVPVLHLLRHLDELAAETHPYDERLARRMIDRACLLKADAYEVMKDHTSVVKASRLGMDVASPDEASYYIHALSAARAMFELGQNDDGYELLNQTMRTAMEHKTDLQEARGILRTGRIGDLSVGAIIGAYRQAVRDFAVTRLGWDGPDFDAGWAFDPKGVLNKMLDDLL